MLSLPWTTKVRQPVQPRTIRKAGAVLCVTCVMYSTVYKGKRHASNMWPSLCADPFLSFRFKLKNEEDFSFYQSFIVASTLLLATTPNYLDDIEYAINVETSRRSDSLYFVVDSSHRKWMNFSLPSTKSRGTEKPNGKPILCKTESGHWKQYGGGESILLAWWH